MRMTRNDRDETNQTNLQSEGHPRHPKTMCRNVHEPSIHGRRDLLWPHLDRKAVRNGKFPTVYLRRLPPTVEKSKNIQNESSRDPKQSGG